ncbi:phosphodiester glycosidase family protein [bacterium]|nr:phosphodiester glycosidase family protein [bacterium]
MHVACAGGLRRSQTASCASRSHRRLRRCGSLFRVQGATQSGPLLVRQGILHPAIRPNSPNTLIRNGVGVRRDGHLCFAISITPVSFHEMAIFLRDQLNCSDTLYLNGTVSALYAPGAGLRPEASGLGPVIGLWQ